MKKTNESKGIVVITGASAGLGRACARAFGESGYDVALIARGMDGLRAGKNEIAAMGRKTMYVSVDIADAPAVDRAAQQIEDELGPIDIWVSNAMNSVFSPISEMVPSDYKRVTEVTYLGQVYGTLAALKRMEGRNKGSLVFVGSALAYRGIPLQSAYCASKHAIMGFYESLRTELMHKKSNIRVSAVQLPAMNTTQFGFVKSRLPKKPRPMGTIYQPEVAAQAIVYAAENARREVLVGFSTLKTIVGNKIAPWYADRVLAKTGFKGQQTEQDEDPDRDNNLWDPIPGDHGAHGNFGEDARSFSWIFRFEKNRTGIIWGIVLLLILILITWVLIE